MADIDIIRTPGNWSDIFLILDDPQIIYTAVATAAVDKSDWSISFGSGAGNLNGCLEDMTLLVGTTPGGWQRGMLRLRKNPGASKFYIGADPSILVQTGDHLTVINDFAPFAKHPIGELMDVDVVYTDQFTNFLPMPCCNGRSRVIRAGETTIFSADRSWVPGSTIDAYAWTFTGATGTTGVNTANPTATFDNSGRFRFSLEVTAANGKSFTAYGFVYVLGDNLSVETDFTLDFIDITATAGGRFRVIMFDRPGVRDNARVLLFAEDYYQGVRQSFGVVRGMENVLIEGRILGETIIRRPEKQQVEFEVAGPIGILSELAALQSGLTDKSLPSDGGIKLPAWSKMSGVTVAKGLHYLAIYRSTIGRCLDFSVEDWGWSCPSLVGTSESLYGQLNEYADRAALNVRSDRCGRIFCERDAQLYPLADRTANIPAVVALEDKDWQEELSVVRRQIGEISIVEAEGYIFSAGKLTRVGARSPGDQPARWGGRDSINELYVPSLGQLFELAGLMASSKNTVLETILVRLAYNNRLMDVAPRMFVNIDIDGVIVRCVPRRLSLRHDPQSGILFGELELEPEGGQWPAGKIVYPDNVVPPYTQPTPPPAPIDPYPPPPSPADGEAVVTMPTDIRTTANLNDDDPDWITEL